MLETAAFPNRDIAVHSPQTSPWQRLVTVVQQLSLARDLQTIMDIVRHAARELTGADGATFVLRDEDKCFYAEEDAIAPLWKGKRFPMSLCISGWVMINKKSTVIPDIYDDPRIPAEAYRPTFVKSLAMVPIRTASPLGAIGNYWGTTHHPTADEVALLSALADTTSVAMENVQIYEELEARVKARTRELETANRELEAFSSSVSHDLRNPLATIKGFAELLEETLAPKLDPDSHTMLHRIIADSNRMDTLITSLLSLSRMNRTPINRQPVDLSAIAEQIFANLRQASPTRNVTLTIEPHLTAHADPTLLRIVLDNLLSNAWKYSAKQPHAHITVARSPDHPHTFFIRDNGAGFNMSQAHRLFTPFQRLHAESDFPGIGVGLATVQRIIQRHGGEISAVSTPNQATTFTFSLPQTT